jgi:hypothetical protein
VIFSRKEAKHWDSVTDMGHDDRASYFVCESCGQHFTPQENAALHPAELLTSDS